MNTDSLKLSAVTVVVPAYNASASIEPCIQALLDQRSEGDFFETIVVDDGSTDDTCEKVKRFPVRLIENPVNRGVAFSRNRGAAEALGEVLVFVDSDIVVQPGGVKKIVDSLVTHTEARIVVTLYSENSAQFNFVTDYKNLDLVYRNTLTPDYTKYIAAYFFAISKSRFDEAGGFSTDFAGSSVEDIDFGYRVCQGEATVFKDRAIEVDHLKNYSLLEMLTTNHRRITNMMKIIKDSSGKNRAGECATFETYLNIILPGLTLGACAIALLLGAPYLWLPTFFILFFIFNNRGFTNFLLPRRGVWFTLKSLGLTFVEYLGVSLAIFVSYLSTKKRRQPAPVPL